VLDCGREKMKPIMPLERSIYLAGGGGMGVEYAQKWRHDASLMLWPMNTISPFRGGKIEKAYNDGHYSGKKCYTPNVIVVRDLTDIKEADGILAEMRSEDYNYIGTCQEIFFGGHDLQIPVVIWTTEKYAIHPWLIAHSVKIFTGELEEACEYLRTYFGVMRGENYA
jgi:hypothetical protein